MIRLGNQAREARKALGLSQVALASAAGVSLATVQNVEAGTANPSMSTVESLLSPLAMSIETKPVPADWDALAAHGAPISMRRNNQVRADGDSLAGYIRRAALELHRSPETPALERKRESLQALILALRTHFPSYFRRTFGRSDLIGVLVPDELSGRVIKLSRIARAALAEYL